MLNDATGFKHIYICTGLCSGFFYPHLYEKPACFKGNLSKR